MDNYVKVEGSSTLYKSATTGFVSNMDIEAYKKAKMRKKARIEKDKKITKLENEVNELKDLVTALIKSNWL